MSPNGQYIFATSVGGFGSCYVAEFNTSTDAVTNYSTTAIFAAVVSNDSQTLWLAGTGTSGPNYVVPFNIATGTFGSHINLPSGVATPDDLVMSPNNRILYAVTTTGITPINVATGSASTTISVSTSAAPAYGADQVLAISPNGIMGYVIDHTSTVTPVNLLTGSVGSAVSLAGLGGHAGDYLSAVATSPDGQTLYVAGDYGYLDQINLANDALATPIHADSGLHLGDHGGVRRPFPTNVSPIALAKSSSSTHSTSTTCGKYPVDCASGDFWHTFVDSSIPTYGPSLQLTGPTTRSRLGPRECSVTAGPRPTGRTSSVNSNAACTALGDANGCVTITEGDGSQVTANPQGGGTFSLPSWADSTLAESGGTYAFTRQGAETFTYSSSGQLTSIADTNGNTESLSYNTPAPGSGQCPAGRRFVRGCHVRLRAGRSHLGLVRHGRHRYGHVADRSFGPADELRLSARAISPQ